MKNASGITNWKSTGIDNYSLKTDLRGIANTSGTYPKVSGETRMSAIFSGNYVKENKAIYPVKSVVNICIIYKLDAIKSSKCFVWTIINTVVMESVLMKEVIFLLEISPMERM